MSWSKRTFFVGKTSEDNDDALYILDKLGIRVSEYEATSYNFKKFDALYFGKISPLKLIFLRLVLWTYVCNGRFAVCE